MSMQNNPEETRNKPQPTPSGEAWRDIGPGRQQPPQRPPGAGTATPRRIRAHQLANPKGAGLVPPQAVSSVNGRHDGRVVRHQAQTSFQNGPHELDGATLKVLECAQPGILYTLFCILYAELYLCAVYSILKL